MYFVFISEKNGDLCHLQHKLIGFYNRDESVYSAVRTGSLNKTVCASSLEGLIPQEFNGMGCKFVITPEVNAVHKRIIYSVKIYGVRVKLINNMGL
jgi:diphthamide biosynthesis methyltransferase